MDLAKITGILKMRNREKKNRDFIINMPKIELFQSAVIK
jgi:hypothetical protein